MSRRLSFRAAILTVLIVVAVLPLALIGLWLTGNAARSGEALLAERLARTLDEAAFAVESGWVLYRSELLDFAEASPAERPAAAARLSAAIHAVRLTGADGTELFQLDRSRTAPLFSTPFAAELDVYDAASRAVVGRIEAQVAVQALGGAGVEEAAGAGAVLTVIDGRTGALLLPVPFDATLLERPRFDWRGEEWLVRRRPLREPQLELAAAAPLSPFVVPFRSAARRGVLALLLVATLGTLAAAVLTHRQTRSLTRLAAAADAVAAGDLGRTVDERANPEVERVARAFNTMTESLRRTLRQLAERESLVAVNEFAAALAHEIRNPLSAIQLDLQEVEERLPDSSDLRVLQSRALDDLRRLERTVAAALATARSGRIEPRSLDLLEPLGGAVRAAGPRFAERGASLRESVASAKAVELTGDPDALRQAFLNLLLNAADALGPGGCASIAVERDDDAVRVRIVDDGEGIAPEHLPRVFDAFYTTRPGGTGVGLAVARRIVAAHGGSIAFESAVGTGTTVIVRLPRAG